MSCATARAELRASYERIRALGSRLLNEQESERSRIARELHDDISQQISLLVIDLAMLRQGGRGEPQKLTDEALSLAEGVVKSVRDLSHRLHPAKLRLIGLVAALRDLQQEMSHTDIPVTFSHDDVPPALPPEPTLCLFRIAQEALQNALKYSHARQVSVRLTGNAEGVVLTIVDDGVGFDVEAAWGKGLGLVSMAERVEAVGGTFEMGSKPGAGTRLAVRVPLSSRQDADTVAV